MPISTEDLRRSIEILRDFGATRILLFGSGAISPETAQDIDLGCQGIPPRHFFLAAGKLLQEITSPIDLIDLTPNTPRNEFIRAHAKVLYEC